MPIPPSTVGFAISLATGIIKLGSRVDRILAEQEAVRGELALPELVLTRTTPAFEMKQKLEQLLRETVEASLEPLSGDRPRLVDLLAQDNPAEDQLLQWMNKYLPGDLEITVDDPSGDFARRMQERLDLDDETRRAALYYIGPGRDLRPNTLAWQLGMAIVDVLAEFALENQSLLIRNQQAQPIITAVLTRFAEPELEQIGSWRGLLTHVLQTTLNGVLDARDALDGQKEWLVGLLDALARARATSQDGDNYVLGLLQGRGYRTLVSTLLQEGAEYLSTADAGDFEPMVSAILQEAAIHVQANRTFEAFFQEHWSDLIRAGLQSVHTCGPVILRGTDPLLQRALLAVVQALAQPGDHTFLSRAVFLDVVGNVINAMAAQPSLLGDAQWLQTVLGSVAAIVREQRDHGLLSQTSLETVLRGSLAGLAAHPEVLMQRPDVMRAVVGPVLAGLSSLPGLGLEPLASATVTGMIQAVAESPTLLDTRYAHVVGTLAERLSRCIADHSLTSLQVSALLEVAATVIPANPQLFTNLHERLAQEMMMAVLESSQNDPHTLIRGSALVLLTCRVLQIVARRGLILLGQGDASQLGLRLRAVLAVGLELAARELGRRLALPHVSLAVAAFVDAWAIGKVPILDANNAALIALFAELAEAVSTSES